MSEIEPKTMLAEIARIERRVGFWVFKWKRSPNLAEKYLLKIYKHELRITNEA